MIVAVSQLHVCDSDYSSSFPSEGEGSRPGNETTDCSFCCVPGLQHFSSFSVYRIAPSLS